MSERATPLDDAETTEAMLEAEVARLRSEVERLTLDRDEARATIDYAMSERASALAESAALRARLAAVEWCFRESAPNHLRYCPECKSAEPHHGDRCQLAAFLAADPKETR